METYNGGIRSTAYGWSIECGKTALGYLEERVTAKRRANDISVGLLGSPIGLSHAHATPLHALAAGWQLMTPPIKRVTDERDYSEWWFQKDSDD